MLSHGRVLWGTMVYDSLKAVDYLVSHPDVETPVMREEIRKWFVDKL